MSHLKLLTFVDWLLKKTQVDADFVQKMDIVTSGIVKIHFNALKKCTFLLLSQIKTWTCHHDVETVR